MDAPNLLNPERRMLRAMQLSEASRSWDLEGILAACDWTDQAVAVGAGQPVPVRYRCVMRENTSLHHTSPDLATPVTFAMSSPGTAGRGG